MTKRKASTAIESGNDSNLSSGAQENNSKDNSNHVSIQGHDNDQNVQNRPTGTRARSQQPNEESDGGSQGKCKKERADNWSNAEIQVLHQGIESRRDIFYGPQSQATKKNREQAWESITKDINAVSSTPRSVSQVMKKFKNEKCRAKRKFMNPDKVGHQININNNDNGTNNNNSSNNSNNIGGNNGSNSNSANNNTINLISQNQSQQHHQQSHLMTNSDTMSHQQGSINVVKIAPQNVAKAMIDLPGHVQQIQMPSDDMVLIVPPEMDGLLSGMNIVSDALNNQPHSHHGQHAIQAINTGQGLVNGTIGNGMMTRTLQTGSMCSLVYSTGGEVCGSDQQQQLANSMATSQHPSNHLNVAGPSIMHHRNPIEQSQGQQPQNQHQTHQPQHHQQMHPHHQPQPPTHPQLQQAQHAHQSHQAGERVQHHSHQTGHTTNQPGLTTSITHQAGGIIASETQLKNLLFDVLLKDGQIPILNQAHENSKQRNDILTVIANSLNKIEDHLGKISMVAANFLTHSINRSSDHNPNVIGNTNQMGSTGVTMNLNGSEVAGNDVSNINRTSSSSNDLQRD